ncbi:TetR/AcrR family transcriptional regulator [Phyllobacterium sp. OV277]|jgi:AcrR family transcriptional regulator|uniref:TetR/AcrR family transcriptional regulator n=1 Tax=Phyllobacterium sp. OV277 TaxID=1882772 RepID=UPI00087F3CE1|nr:TetR/AcrR family transcriptional regulator [Phyllobacterium sp. OV277]SDP65206.1 transcriptional regulator, TetR family [Phyllobacterium sp. OV277]
MVDNILPRPTKHLADEKSDREGGCFVTKLFGKRAQNREVQEARILEAATTCFVRAGFHGASMNDICSEAGMSPGALYRYFPSKESIIETIVAAHRKASAEILDRMSAYDNIIDALVMVGMEHIHQKSATSTGDGVGDANARIFAEIRAEAIRNEAVAAQCELYEGQMREQLLSAISAAKNRGEIDPIGDLGLVAATLAAMGEGVIMRNFPAQGVPVEALEPMFRALAVAILRPVKA